MPPDNPESVRGAKEWLTQRMGRPYRPTLDQEPFARVLDIELARAAPSFDKFYRELSRLLGAALAELEDR